jgi:hypothetical protein
MSETPAPKQKRFQTQNYFIEMSHGDISIDALSDNGKTIDFIQICPQDVEEAKMIRCAFFAMAREMEKFIQSNKESDTMKGGK